MRTYLPGDLRGADLRGICFDGAILEHCDLRHAHLWCANNVMRNCGVGMRVGVWVRTFGAELGLGQPDIPRRLHYNGITCET